MSGEESKAGFSTPLRSGRNDGLVGGSANSGFVAGAADAVRPTRGDGSAETVAAQARDARPWLLLVSLLVILVDRFSKLWINGHLETGQAISVIPGVFRITHVLNFGAAFSMFAESASPLAVRSALIVFSIVAGLIVLGLLLRMGRVFSPASLGLALIFGGAIGNLYDRIKLHYVIDFLEVRIVHYHWPDFNVADSCISIGAVLLLVELLWPKSKQTHVDDVSAVAE